MVQLTICEKQYYIYHFVFSRITPTILMLWNRRVAETKEFGWGGKSIQNWTGTSSCKEDAREKHVSIWFCGYVRWNCFAEWGWHNQAAELANRRSIWQVALFFFCFSYLFIILGLDKNYGYLIFFVYHFAWLVILVYTKLQFSSFFSLCVFYCGFVFLCPSVI